MSSTKFNVNPSTGGTGSTNVTVSSKLMNDTHADYKGRIVISDGTNTKNVNVTQYGVPTIYQRNGYATIGGTGGTLDFTVYSHYPFKFNNVPSYVSISDSRGNNYDNMPSYNPWIPAERATEPSTAISPNYFLITLAPNTGSQRTTAGFNMSFEKDYYEQTTMTTPINITQLAADERPHMDVDPSILYIDFEDENTRKINVGTNMRGWQTFLTGNTAFTISQSTSTGNGIVSATTLVWNSGTTFIRGNVKCMGTSAGTVHSASTQLIQYYMPDMKITGATSTVYAEGGTRVFEVSCPYVWEWNNPIPDWITVTDANGNAKTPTPTGEGIDKYYFHIAPNSGAERTYDAQAKFYRHDGGTGATLRNITITQRAPAESEFVVFYDQWNDRIDQLTFPYSATNGSARLLGVSANTRWWTSWEDGTYFDLPYTETGTTGGQYIQVNYVGPRDDTSSITDTLIVSTVGGNEFSCTIKKPKRPTIRFVGNDYNVPATGGTKMFEVNCAYPFWIMPQPMPAYIHWYYYDMTTPLTGTSSNPNPPLNGFIYAVWDAVPDGYGTRRDSFNMVFKPNSNTSEQYQKYDFVQFVQISENIPDYVVITPDVGYFSPDAQSGDTITFTISAGTSYDVTFPSHMYNWDKFEINPTTGAPGVTTITITYKGPYDPTTEYKTILGGYKASDGSSWAPSNIWIYKPAAD